MFTSANFSFDQGAPALMGILVVLWIVASALFWMLVAWRAMRAHERIALALTQQAEPEDRDLDPL